MSILAKIGTLHGYTLTSKHYIKITAMNKHILMLTKEPTDKQLKELMNEVGNEVREKVRLTQQSMNNKIREEIQALQQKMSEIRR